MNRLPFGLSQSVAAWVVALTILAAVVLPVGGLLVRVMDARGEIATVRAETQQLHTALAAQASGNSDLARQGRITADEVRVASDLDAARDLMTGVLADLETLLLAAQAHSIVIQPPQIQGLGADAQSFISDITFMAPRDAAFDVLRDWQASAVRIDDFVLLALSDGQVQVRARVSLVSLRDRSGG